MGRILVRGEPGRDIIPELKPLDGESIIDQRGRSSFVNTDLALIRRANGGCNIILAGVTTDVCVHSTMRNSDDLGYECLLFEDYCAASFAANHDAFGAASDSNKLVAALTKD